MIPSLRSSPSILIIYMMICISSCCNNMVIGEETPTSTNVRTISQGKLRGTTPQKAGQSTTAMKRNLEELDLMDPDDLDEDDDDYYLDDDDYVVLYDKDVLEDDEAELEGTDILGGYIDFYNGHHFDRRRLQAVNEEEGSLDVAASDSYSVDIIDDFWLDDDDEYYMETIDNHDQDDGMNSVDVDPTTTTSSDAAIKN